VVERALPALAERRAGGGNNDCLISTLAHHSSSENVVCPCFLAVEGLSFLGEAYQQWRRLPLRALVALLEFLDRGEHLVEPDGIGVEHRPAAVRREAVAGEVDHVDVGS